MRNEKNATLTRVSKTAEQKKKAREHALKEGTKSRVEGVTHREFSKTDAQFKEACELAEIPPTRRQAQKFRAGFGLARKAVNDSKRSLQSS